MAEYTIAELTERTGVNRRTIHFYVQQGLLPPPEGAGLGARYSDEHLLRLQAIPLLRRQGLRLDDIRAQLAGLDRPGLQAVVGHRAPLPPVRTAAEPAALAGPPDREPADAPGQIAWPHGQPVTRYVLAPGIELLVDAAAEPRLRARAAELAQAIQRVLGPHSASQSNGGRK
jgi:DNA-binding transcriptional MerR regulator